MAIINYLGKNVKTYKVSCHQHNYWEIIYCTAGDGKITYDNGEILYKTGQIAIIPPKILHSNTSEHGFKNIHFTVENWSPIFRGPSLVSDNAQKDILKLLNMCYRYFNGSVPNKGNLIIAYSDLILSLLASFADNIHISKHIEKVEDAILENFADPDFVVENAYVGQELSNDYIRRQFIKEKGISPLQFLIITRINFAQKLLLDNQTNHLKIHQISEMSGFTDQLYFSRVFKKITGVSPKKYVELPRLSNYKD